MGKRQVFVAAMAMIAVASLITFSTSIGLISLPSQGSERLVIGSILPLSGKNAVYGQEIQNAIELALEEINNEGGINGKELVVLYEDDQADPKMGASAMQKLVNLDKVPVVLGSWASGVVVATAPIAEEGKTVVMASAISPAITDAGDYIFRMQPSATFYTRESVKYLEREGISKAAVIYVNNEFGKAMKDAFVSEFEGIGGRIVAVESYAQGDTDFRTQLAKIKEREPELIFIPGYQEGVEVIKQVEEIGIESRIMASTPFESEATLEKLGELAEGVIYPYHFVAGRDNEKARHYEQAYLAKYGVPTGGFAPLMYDATHIIANALEKCGEDTACIKEELYRTEYEGATGLVSFDGNGDPIIPIVMKTVRDGKFVEYEG